MCAKYLIPLILLPGCRHPDGGDVAGRDATAQLQAPQAGAAPATQTGFRVPQTQRHSPR